MIKFLSIARSSINSSTSSSLVVMAFAAILIGAMLATGNGMLNLRSAQAASGVGNMSNLISNLRAVQGASDIDIKGGNIGNKIDNGGDNKNNNDNFESKGSDSRHSGGDSDSGNQGQFCYDTSVTNPFTDKIRSVHLCFGDSNNCEQAQQHDSDSKSGCRKGS